MAKRRHARQHHHGRVTARGPRGGGMPTLLLDNMGALLEQAAASGVGEQEAMAVLVVGAGQDPANEPCDGPVVVHEDGTIECASRCEGVMRRFHDEDDVEPCAVADRRDLGHRCDRCS